MKPRSSLPAISFIALAGMLAFSAGQANAAEKYANQEVSYAKPASQPSTEQVQPPSDAASNPAAGFTSAEGRSMSFELVKDSSGQPQQLGDTATHEVGHRRAKQDIEVENDETHVAIPRTETAAVGGSGGSGGASAQAFTGYLKIEGVVAQPVEGDAGQTAGSGASGKQRDGLMADQLEEVRTKKPRRDRNGTRGKRMHKP